MGGTPRQQCPTDQQPTARVEHGAVCRPAVDLCLCCLLLCAAALLLLLLVQEDHGSGPPSTRVACTIGPESNSVEALTSMLQTGMAVGRLCWSDSAQLRLGCCRLCENAGS